MHPKVGVIVDWIYIVLISFSAAFQPTQMYDNVDISNRIKAKLFPKALRLTGSAKLTQPQ